MQSTDSKLAEARLRSNLLFKSNKSAIERSKPFFDLRDAEQTRIDGFRVRLLFAFSISTSIYQLIVYLKSFLLNYSTDTELYE